MAFTSYEFLFFFSSLFGDSRIQVVDLLSFTYFHFIINVIPEFSDTTIVPIIIFHVKDHSVRFFYCRCSNDNKKRATGFELTQSGIVPILVKKERRSELEWMRRERETRRLHRNNWIISGEQLYTSTHAHMCARTHTRAQTFYQENEKKTERRKKTSVINYWLTVTFYQITMRCGLTWFRNYFFTSQALFNEKSSNNNDTIHLWFTFIQTIYSYFFLHFKHDNHFMNWFSDWI